MFQNVLSEVKDSARATARAAAFSALGTVFAIAGLGFLTAAFWMLLASLESALFAATVIGALYCAFGFGLLALGMRSRSRASRPSSLFDEADKSAANQPREPFVQMAEGFAMGLQAGRSVRSGRT